uniref:Alpha-dioxygenase 2 n=1 Tax=Rhizophora mucronata TaxID=61149 RepID=A0A2P2LZ32_RHIMU
MSFCPCTSPFFHPQLKHAVTRMTFLDTILFHVVHSVDKLGSWHKLPVFMGLLYLQIGRRLRQRYNLLHVGETAGQKYAIQSQTGATGAATDDHSTGDDMLRSHGRFFGRNMPPATSSYGLLDPHPTLVADRLLARKTVVDNGKQFNMIACSWIQFMVHDWVDHMEDTKQQVEIRAPEEIADGCPPKSFKFYKTKEVATGSPVLKTRYLNRRTPWWDGSVIYGNDGDGKRRVRTFNDGKLKIAGDGLLEHDEKGIPILGDVRNIWAGLSVLQALFVEEHNAVCDMLKVSDVFLYLKLY